MRLSGAGYKKRKKGRRKKRSRRGGGWGVNALMYGPTAASIASLAGAALRPRASGRLSSVVARFRGKLSGFENRFPPCDDLRKKKILFFGANQVSVYHPNRDRHCVFYVDDTSKNVQPIQKSPSRSFSATTLCRRASKKVAPPQTDLEVDYFTPCMKNWL